MIIRIFAASAAVVVLALSAAFGPAAPARADVESWNWLEVRLPVSDGQHGLPHSLRLWTDARYGLRYSGLGQLFMRVGPIWELHPNLFLATHVTTYSDQAAPGVHDQEHRLELEPNLRGRLADLSWNDRNRLEYRWRPAGSRFRYRNQLRVSWQPDGATVFPYLWDEALIDLSGATMGLTQNRAAAGVSFLNPDGTRLDVAYVFRSRADAALAWDHDHIALLSLYFQPRVAPLLPGAPDAGTQD